MSKFAERLKELRENKNLSQSDLAFEIKVSVACVSRWESDLRVPNINSIITLCKYFNCSSDYLIGVED